MGLLPNAATLQMARLRRGPPPLVVRVRVRVRVWVAPPGQGTRSKSLWMCTTCWNAPTSSSTPTRNDRGAMAPMARCSRPDNGIDVVGATHFATHVAVEAPPAPPVQRATALSPARVAAWWTRRRRTCVVEVVGVEAEGVDARRRRRETKRTRRSHRNVLCRRSRDCRSTDVACTTCTTRSTSASRRTVHARNDWGCVVATLVCHPHLFRLHPPHAHAHESRLHLRRHHPPGAAPLRRNMKPTTCTSRWHVASSTPHACTATTATPLPPLAWEEGLAMA